MQEYQVEKISTGNFNTYVCRAGIGNEKTLVLLHGSGPGANAESNWSKVMANFGEHYHVLAIDLLGFGQTDLPLDLNLTFWEWTTLRIRQIIEVLDYYSVEKASLVGNSMGGLISLNAVIYDESRFEEIILMGSGGGKNEKGPSPEIVRMTRFFNDPNIHAFRNLVKWFMYDESSLSADLDEIVASRYENIMRPEIRELYPKLFTQNPMEMVIAPSALRRIKQRVLLIHGYEDAFVPKECSLWLMEYIPNAEMTFVKQCGHWVQIEKKERFVELTKSFIGTKVAVSK